MAITLISECASTHKFSEETLSGLRAARKTLPCKYFYDERGSRLFDEICELPEYYPTRTEMEIMRTHVGEMAQRFPTGCALVEYGSGSSTKTRYLLDSATDISMYVPVDISHEHLVRTARALARAYPRIVVAPVSADYCHDFILPDLTSQRPCVVYFPGSTIGNFHPAQAEAFLKRIARLCGRDGGLLIGVDLKKDIGLLERAYNDAAGVTAQFNKNLLLRINRELGANFDLDQFAHHAFYNTFAGRIEMHLVSLQAQTVTVGSAEIAFDEDETIHTECSYKYTVEEFGCLAERSGWRLRQVWTDPDRLFSVHYLAAA